MTGETIGPYTIVGKLGEGGMGQVWRATDSTLGRQVAIKILPDAFASDPERLARFEREAKTLASLNHPHIAAIYRFEKSSGMHALVMELVEGEDLSQRIARGAIPLDEALPIAKQIAEALEAAHEQGIIHRDLKPANIKLRTDGTVKVLDFGLAKAMDSGAGDSGSGHLANSPTITTPAMTMRGMILGTAAYMSPEQARGKAVDKRSDIWAFGAVLYEMLSGTRPFDGDDATDVIAAVVKTTPNWSALPADVPRPIVTLIQRCLEKDRKARVGDIAVARFLLADTAGLGAATAPPQRPAASARIAWGVALVAIVAVAAVSWTRWAGRGGAVSPVAPSLHVMLPLPPAQPFSRLAALAATPKSAIAVSPDGSRVAYVADLQGTSQVIVRGLAESDATPLAGTEGADLVFFSPDSHWLGFSSGGKLKKVALGGGAPTVLADVRNLRGASWGDDGTIVFSPEAYSGLWRVSSSGGVPQALAELDAASGERNHRWPDVLPGSRAVLFTVGTGGTLNDARIVVQSLDSGKRTTIVEGGTNPRYIPSGHIVYSRDGALTAIPFDLKRLQATGPPVKVLDDVLTESSGAAQFSFSATGTLLAVPGRGLHEGEGAPVWVDRQGRVTPTALTSAQYRTARLSSDGSRIVSVRNDADAGLWVHDLARGTGIRLDAPSRVMGASWFGAGDRVIYPSERPEGWTLAEQRATYSQKETAVADLRGSGVSVSADGRQIAYIPNNGSLKIYSLPGRTSRDIDVVRPNMDGASRAFSPDGRFLAITSGDGARQQVWVYASQGSERWQVSTDGGAMPRWHPNGRELFYWRGNQLISVPVTTVGSFSAGTATVLFEGRFDSSAYDVSPDGTRFMTLQPPDAGPPQFMVVTNWFAEVARLVGGRVK